MAKVALGFIKERTGSEEKKGTEEKVALRGIEREFDRMLAALQVEKKKLASSLRLEKKIKRELVKIHKRIKKLEELVVQRGTLLARIKTLQRSSPKEALALLEKVEKIDAEIGPMSKEISDELLRHTLPEIAELYEGVNLSREEIVAIRDVALTLGESLNQVMYPVNYQEPENIRKSIYYNHPSLH